MAEVRAIARCIASLRWQPSTGFTDKVAAGFRETALPIREIDPGGYPRTGMADDKEAAYLSPRAGPVKARFVPSYAHKSADLRTAGGTRRGASGKGFPAAASPIQR